MVETRTDLIQLLESDQLHLPYSEMIAGIDATRKEALLGRFYDPFDLFADPTHPTSMFHPAVPVPGKLIRSYPELAAFDIRADLGATPKWTDDTSDQRLVPIARNLINTVKLGHKIPRVMSFLWMGGPFTKERGWAEVETFADAPGNYPNVILWTDVPRPEVRQAYLDKGTHLQPDSPAAKRKRGVYEMAAWCVAHGIWLLNVDEVFYGANAMSLQPLFNLCRATRLWGAASDIFRYELLYRLGGGYSDIDNKCLAHYKKLEDWYTKVPHAPRHRFAMCTHNTTPTMAALFSTPGNPIIGDIVKYVKGQFGKSKEAIITQDAPYPRLYKLGFGAYMETGMHDVLARTGPNAFFTALFGSVLGNYSYPARRRNFDPVQPSQVASEIAEAIFLEKKGEPYYPDQAPPKGLQFLRVSTIPKKMLAIDSAGTWVDRKMLPIRDVAECRIALTSLAYALVSDPKTLDLTVLDFRSATPLQLLRILQGWYAPLLQSVERVYMLPTNDDALRRVRLLLGENEWKDWVTETNVLGTRNFQEDGRVSYRV